MQIANLYHPARYRFAQQVFANRLRVHLRLGLGRLTSLLILLHLLPLLLSLLLILPLQFLDLLIGLGDRFEEPLKSRLLARLQVLLELSYPAPDSLLGKCILNDEELDEPFNVGLLPLEVTIFVVRRPDVWVEEELPRVGVRPVFRDGIFVLIIVVYPLNNLFEGSVFTDQFKGGVGADLWDGVEVITAKKDAEIDKLDRLVFEG